MKLYVIYDDRRPEKLPLLLEELHSQNVDYEIFPAIVEAKKSVIENINASHKALVRMAKEKKMPCICIGEDDLMFPVPGAWQYFLDNIPEVYDVYVASSYMFPLSMNLLTGFHLYIVHERFYDQYLAVSGKEHIDNAICDLRGDYKICYPFAALQRPGWSSNSMTDVNYQTGTGVKPEDVFQG